ncbi:MAG: NUDIX hydrolase [Deltaproteobacteria bacterium]|nr:MAG: NUDIX hydrolase [Deltaproteobacteria bacterium]
MIEVDAGGVARAPRDAATVVLLRPEDGGFSVFMVQRHQKSAFMGGAYVFPGGKLDEADSSAAIVDLTRGLSRDAARLALGEPDPSPGAIGLYIAAVRETFEEAGVLLASGVDPESLANARARLEGGDHFAKVVQDLGVTLDLTQLTPWTRWVTPTVEPRRYDARFFVARSPAGQRAVHDAHETTAGAWMTPQHALVREAAEEIQLPPPTLRSLEMLAAYDDIDSVFRDAAKRPPAIVEPVFRDDDGVWSLVLPGHPDHPIRDAILPGPTRFILEDGRWRSAD